jgi:hypothetical protein
MIKELVVAQLKTFKINFENQVGGLCNIFKSGMFFLWIKLKIGRKSNDYVSDDEYLKTTLKII